MSGSLVTLRDGDNIRVVCQLILCLWTFKNYKYSMMKRTMDLTNTPRINSISDIRPNMNLSLKKPKSLLKAKSAMANTKAKFGNVDTSQAPTKLYEAAATLALLTGAALEGAGLALKEAIQEKKLNANDARQIVGNLAKGSRSFVPGQFGGQMSPSLSSSSSALSLNLPPGVELATNTIIDIASKAKTVVGDGLDIAAKKTYEIGSQLLDDAVDAVVPVELLDKSYGDLNPQLTAKLSAISNNLEAMARDPEARAAIGNLAKATADIGIDAVNAAMPNINRLVDRIWTVANNVGAKSVRSAMNVGMAMLVTALSEVPVVGGVVVGGLEAGSIFNNVVETGSKAVQGFTQIAKDGMETMTAVANSVGNTQEKLVAPISQVKSVYDKYAVGGGGSIRGGRIRHHNKTRRKSTSVDLGNERTKIEKRLRKSLKAFFG